MLLPDILTAEELASKCTHKDAASDEDLSALISPTLSEDELQYYESTPTQVMDILSDTCKMADAKHGPGPMDQILQKQPCGDHVP